MKHLLLFVSPLIIAHSALGDIGDTFDQCVQRYGQPLNPYAGGGRPFIFRHRDVVISISLFNSRVIQIDFLNLQSVTDARVRELLALVSSNAKWNESTPTTEPRRWETADSKLIALYIKPANVLSVQPKKERRVDAVRVLGRWKLCNKMSILPHAV